MSDSNPYSSSQTAHFSSHEVVARRVSIEPIDLYKRSLALMGDQYLLFLGITLAGVFVGSIVPMGILMGPMMVGIYMCFADRERGKTVEFGTLFKGFDQFVSSFIAMLIMIGLTLLVMIPLMIMMFIAMILVLPSNGGGNQGSFMAIPLILGFYLMLFIAVFLIQLPFLFAFQLIADRGLTGPQAVGLSFRGVQKNLGGCIFLAILMGFFSMLASAACIIPAFFLMPISMGVLFLAYRDIFGKVA